MPRNKNCLGIRAAAIIFLKKKKKKRAAVSITISGNN